MGKRSILQVFKKITGHLCIYVVIGTGLILALFKAPTIYSRWLLNRAFISYTAVLVGAPESSVEQNAHENLQRAYLQASYYEPGIQQQIRYRLLPLWISGDAPPTEGICPPSQEVFLFIDLLHQANARVQSQNYDGAEALYKWLASNCPNSFDVWVAWAALKETRGDFATGVSLLETAVTLEPQMATPNLIDKPRASWRDLALAGAYADLGDLQAKNHQLDQAIASLEYSVALHPPGTVSPWLYQYLGILYYQAEKLDMARWALEAALAIKPDLPDAPLYLKLIEGKQ